MLFDVHRQVPLRCLSIRIHTFGALSLRGGCLTTLKLPSGRDRVERKNIDRDTQKVWSVPAPRCSVFPAQTPNTEWRKLWDNPLSPATLSMQSHEKSQPELPSQVLRNSWPRGMIRNNQLLILFQLLSFEWFIT